MNLRCEIVKKVSTKLKPLDTSDNNTLINELKAIIDKDNLKAY